MVIQQSQWIAVLLGRQREFALEIHLPSAHRIGRVMFKSFEVFAVAIWLPSLP